MAKIKFPNDIKPFSWNAPSGHLARIHNKTAGLPLTAAEWAPIIPHVLLPPLVLLSGSFVRGSDQNELR